MAAVQQGMKMAGYAGNIPNPKSEGAFISLHRNLAAYWAPPRPNLCPAHTQRPGDGAGDLRQIKVADPAN